MASIPKHLGKPVPEWQTILDFNAARDERDSKQLQ